MVNASQSIDSPDEVRQKLLNLEGLPPFPATASQILMQCQKPEVDARAVAQLVECEPAISAKVIQLANSPLYGASRPIVSIGHAIVLLGFRSVSQMAISIAAGSMFGHGDPKLAAHRKETFRQSLACAITSRMLAAQFESVNPDDAFLCGVMHDVGKLVLFDAAAQQYCDMLEREPTGNSTAAEQVAFGIDHAGLGMRCGRKWGFPNQINVAIEQHHRMLADVDHALSQAVMVGNYFSRRWTLTENSKINQPENAEIESLLSTIDMAAMRDECLDQFETVIEICGA